jgi:transcriptional regulator with XRE-family HTH domain
VMDRKFNSKRLILARQRRRLTGKGLADVAGLSANTVSRLENGENEPDEQTVDKIASSLDYPTAFFYADDPMN